LTNRSAEEKEAQRRVLQDALDRERSRSERNRLGQFATPSLLASEVVETSLSMLGKRKKGVSFLDPAFGTGSFFAALSRHKKTVKRALGFEIDPHYSKPAIDLWSDTALRLKTADFFDERAAKNGGPVDLLVCNPPYVRHHHIEAQRKLTLQARVKRELGLDVSGLAGLYVYYLLLSHAWLGPDGMSVWLIPGEFMDVNYGRPLKDYLSSRVTLVRIHRFRPEDVQFADALVSSVVIWLQNKPPARQYDVEISEGGSIATPHASRSVPIGTLRTERRWSGLFAPEQAKKGQRLEHGLTLRDVFRIRRGVATGANEFFVLDERRAQSFARDVLKPLLPPPRRLEETEVLAEPNGDPALSPKSFLLDVRLPLSDVRARFPLVANYLEEGEAKFAARYLCRSRRYWYEQEVRKPAPLLCTYMGRSSKRGAPFRFILNHSDAIATNVYLMLYPKPMLDAVLHDNQGMLRDLWTRLDALAAEHFRSLSRVYGGGLHKFEPSELGALPLGELGDMLRDVGVDAEHQAEFFEAAS